MRAPLAHTFAVETPAILYYILSRIVPMHLHHNTRTRKKASCERAIAHGLLLYYYMWFCFQIKIHV